MKKRNVTFWINQISAKEKYQPQNTEELAAYDIADFLIYKEEEKRRKAA